MEKRKSQKHANIRLCIVFCIFACTYSFLATDFYAQTSIKTAEIAAVGDILLTRGVEKKIRRFGTKFPFENVKEILSGADIAFGNLENTLSEKCEKVEKKYSFQAKPKYSNILSDAGLDILSLANNHSFDCGQTGLTETLENLKKIGIKSIGAGNTKADAETPNIIEVNGIKFVFLAFTDVPPFDNSGSEEVPTVAKATEDEVKTSVKLAKKQADIVIVSFHWGKEYSFYPNKRQIDLAHAAVDAGADLVLGHHPHVLQGFELIQKQGGKEQALIAYSLGNFVFDSSPAISKRVNESVILKCKFSKIGLISAEVVPVFIENYRPIIASGVKKQDILDHLSKASDRLKTALSDNRLIKEKN